MGTEHAAPHVKPDAKPEPKKLIYPVVQTRVNAAKVEAVVARIAARAVMSAKHASLTAEETKLALEALPSAVKTAAAKK